MLLARKILVLKLFTYNVSQTMMFHSTSFRSTPLCSTQHFAIAPFIVDGERRHKEWDEV